MEFPPQQQLNKVGAIAPFQVRAIDKIMEKLKTSGWNPQQQLNKVGRNYCTIPYVYVILPTRPHMCIKKMFPNEIKKKRGKKRKGRRKREMMED